MKTMTAYLDYNATVPVRPEVVEAVMHALQQTGNPSSVHYAGRVARQRMETARAQVAALVRAEAEWVTFTSGGTEANNLVLRGLDCERAVVSAVEHDSVLVAAGASGAAVEIVPVDGQGRIDLQALDGILAGGTDRTVVSVMLANNETGVIQPVAEVARLARAHGAMVHCDAIQAAGKIPVDIRRLGVELMSLSAHKLGGPQGVGALVAAPHVNLSPILFGGRQETARRAGTENVAGVVGFGVAAEMAASDCARDRELGAMRDETARQLKEIAPGVKELGEGAARLPNTLCVTMPGVTSETQVMGLDLAGVAVSAGAACSSGKVKLSHVLGAMGVPEDVAMTAIRVSLGWRTVSEDLERFVRAWSDIYFRAAPKLKSSESAA